MVSMATNKHKSYEINFLLKYLLRIGANLEKIGNRILSEYNLNQQQFLVLNEIHRNNKITQAEMVTELAFEKSNISKIIRKLKILKYIEISRNESDGRSSEIKCTNKGSEIWKKCIDKLDKENNAIFHQSTIAELNKYREFAYNISQIIFPKS